MPPNANGDANGKPNAPLTTSAKATNTKTHDTEAKIALDKPTFCGTITTARVEARERREKRRSKPQPWVVRKLTVALTVGIIGYAGYVYAGRFAVRLMRGGRRPEGIGLLVGAAILYAWMVWAYVKVIITPPGTANDYISKTPPPLFPAPTRTQADWDAYDAQREQDRREQAEAYARHTSTPPNAPADAEDDTASSFDWREGEGDDAMARGRIGGPVYAPPPNPASATNGDADVNSTPPPAVSFPPAAAASPPPGRKSSGRARWGRRDTLDRGDSARTNNAVHDSTNGSGRLPARVRTTAPLLAPHRYCTRCEIVKPHRAHHCRACGKCILKYDHHCPWIGQCVGARNHKFFINFLVATVCFTTYTLISVVIFNTGWRMHIGEGDTDPQEVVLIALAALFLLFTLPLGLDHTRLVLSSMTTVESMNARHLREREDAALVEEGVPWWDVGTKRRRRLATDAEWGSPAREGNVWWAGSRRAAWEDVMGKGRWGWVFPIGAPLGDGLHYVPNPRFDESGRWRRRSEWPEGVR
ncbi:DHHC palmitoyltransferase-domain-containing protein [Mycena sanguinolenta]|nr:DHHC palmitoyltransferase-domain-containing protein [Mycena sanguinolenta]